MPPSPAASAYTLRKVFSKDEDQDNENDDADRKTAVRNHEDEQLVSSSSAAGASNLDSVSDLQRVISRVQSYQADGSTEAILSAAVIAPVALSRTKSTNIANNTSSRLSDSVPMTRTKSTPHGTTTNNTKHSILPGRISYAMRRVFSREEKSDWHRQEAEELVVRSSSDSTDHTHTASHATTSAAAAAPPPANGKSRVTSRVASMEENNGAELVLDEDHETTDSVYRFNKHDGYKLRRFLSTPNSGRGQKPTSGLLHRTPSYDHEGYVDNDYDDGNDGYNGESPLYNTNELHLASPIGLQRTISFRRNKSGLKQQQNSSGKNHKKNTNGKIPNNNLYDDDDLSTVAESIAGSSNASYTGSPQRKDQNKKAKKSLLLKRLAVALFCIAVGVAGVGVYLMMGSGKDEVHTSQSATVNSNYEYTKFGGGDGSSDEQLTVVADDSGKNDYESGDQAGAKVDTEVESDQVGSADGSYDKAEADEVDSLDNSYDEELSVASESSDEEEGQSRPSGGGSNNLKDEPVDGAPNILDSESQNTPTQEETEPSDDGPVDSATEVMPPPLGNVAVNTTSPTTTSPSEKPTPKPTNKPTSSPTVDTYTKFYLMADCPYDDNERENLMPAYIEDLSTNAEFLVHLGDLQYAKVDECQEYAYREARAILRKSPIPTFVLPGDNDINDCDDHEHGEEMWMEYFHKIDERHWDHNFELTRWGDLDESFSFLHKQVLYFGINIVGGSPYSKSEKRRRHAEHLEYIREIIDGLDEDDFKVLVLFGHAEPSDHHEDFFEGNDGFAAIVEELGKPTIHFHGDHHEYYEVEGDFDVDNYMRISLDGESIAPPIKVEIDVSRKNPIRVSRRESGLKTDCCRHGWPRRDEL